MPIDKEMAVAQTMTKVQRMQSSMPLGQMATGERVPVTSRRQDQPLYDTVAFSALTGQQTLRFFAAMAGKSEVDTNMLTEASMTGQSTFAFHAIRVQILCNVAGVAPTLSDMLNIRANCYLQYLKGSKPIWRSPIEKLPAPGFFGLQSQFAGGAIDAINLGNGVPRDYHPLGFTVSIPAGRGYGIELKTAPEFAITTYYFRVRVWLEGILSNPVR